MKYGASLFPLWSQILRSLIQPHPPVSLTLMVLAYSQVFFTFPQLFLQILQKKPWEQEFKASSEPQLLPLQPKQVQLSLHLLPLAFPLPPSLVWTVTSWLAPASPKLLSQLPSWVLWSPAMGEREQGDMH